MSRWSGEVVQDYIKIEITFRSGFSSTFLPAFNDEFTPSIYHFVSFLA